ncbi:hypothetical protein FOPG_11481 [Fusarium oxysporum f. sp. conglutinans race 2 54008]|uniref:Condensation domain-containing protein n=1 Tax=Fusarium oxysporum f. sp. conglutinans race 2 54008 TaxID=1089457 RepID=X0HA50_FUSOX|nr:hypothetical protein FOPG_11481 [Fusarium oxysporum f. sp. conglutinans race 2 54008]
MFLLVLAAAAFSSLALSKSLPWTTLAQLEHGTFLENIATRSNGDILTTELWPSAAIYTIRNPHTGHNSLQKLFSVTSIQSIYGLTQVKSSRRGTETFIFVGGNSTSPGNTITGSFGAWAVDFDLLNNDFRLRKVSDMGTDSRFLNGVTAIPGISDIVLVADSANGLVGRLNITTGIFDTSAFRYPLEMDPVEGARLPIGVNGIKIRGGHLYWTNSFQASIYRIAITPNGYPAKGTRPEIVADLSNGVGFLDDFSFDFRGNIYAATNLDNSIVRIDITTKAWKTIIGGIGEMTVPGCTEDGFVQIVLNKPETPVTQYQTPTCPEDLLARQSRPKFTDDQPKHSFTVCRSEDGSVTFRLDICHYLCDSYSISILLEDVVSVYSGDVMQNVPQFSDVVRHIKRRPISETLTFWTSVLHGVEPCQIPVSKLCQGDPELDIHNTISIPFESMTGVTEQCKQMGLTRSTFIHLAWALVLPYITGMDETCFGYILSGRDVPVEGIGRIFGPMANMLINRADLGESLEADAALIARNLKSHRRHQQTSLAEIHHDLGNKDERRRLFNTIVSLLRSNPSGVKRLYFEKYHQVSSHEFNFVLEGRLHPSTFDLALHYRTAGISHDEVQKAGTILI